MDLPSAIKYYDQALYDKSQASKAMSITFAAVARLAEAQGITVEEAFANAASGGGGGGSATTTATTAAAAVPKKKKAPSAKKRTQEDVSAAVAEEPFTCNAAVELGYKCPGNTPDHKIKAQRAITFNKKKHTVCKACRSAVTKQRKVANKNKKAKVNTTATSDKDEEHEEEPEEEEEEQQGGPTTTTTNNTGGGSVEPEEEPEEEQEPEEEEEEEE